MTFRGGNMIITRYQQKQYAISQMQNLFFDDEVINAFNKANKVPFFKNGILSDMPKEIQEKLKIIEKEKNCLVYAVTEERNEFCNFLLISDYRTDAENSIRHITVCVKSVYSWVWNREKEHFSEFGYIGILCDRQGIRRIYE